MILRLGEKVHIIHRRHWEKEPHRHFVGVVEGYDQGVVRVNGFLFTVDTTKAAFERRPDRRTRLVSLVSGDVFANVIPESVDLERVVYVQERSCLRVTDGSEWHLDISEVAWI